MKRLFRSISEDIRRDTILTALVFAFAAGYYINPLANVDITHWDRILSLASIEGVSVNTRISHIYLLILVFLPLLFAGALLFMVMIGKKRPVYAGYYKKLGVFCAVVAFISYVSRYTSDPSYVKHSPMLECMLVFLAILFVIALLDRKEEYSFAEIVLFFLTFVVLAVSATAVFHEEKLLSCIAPSAALVVCLAAGNLYTRAGRKAGKTVKNFLYFLLWTPAFIIGELEGIYILTAYGRGIEQYFTHISRATAIVILLMGLIVFALRKKNLNWKTFGYVGVIVSFTALVYFEYRYQRYVTNHGYWYYYELGNPAVGMDTWTAGKLPIIDYFSAHALSDVLYRLVYVFIYGDPKGLLLDTYDVLTVIPSFIILFFILKQLFDAESAVLFTLLFPGNVNYLKWVNCCFIVLAMLLYICRKPSVKHYLLFWLSALFSAFFQYDTGVSLGIACILTYMIFCICRKDRRRLSGFILCGVSIGGTAFALYAVYALATGIPVIGRIREWLSLTQGTNLAMGTSVFGDQTAFAFLFTYFIVPCFVVIALVSVLVRFARTGRNPLPAVFAMAFAIAELLFIPRSVAYHNLFASGGMSGVTLNFIHWTTAAWALYLASEKWRSENLNMAAFSGAMLLVLMTVGAVVTDIFPIAGSALLYSGFRNAEGMNLRDGYTSNVGKPRILYDERTQELADTFSEVFDTLLTDDQTFIDFANMTCLYMMTGRERPMYIGQSPGFLTDPYSQQCFIDEVSRHDCPLALMGTTGEEHLLMLNGIPSACQHYQAAEYLYLRYRPLLNFSDFSIWCKNELWDEYHALLVKKGFEKKGYRLTDYGYDFTTAWTDDEGKTKYTYQLFHSYDLKMEPYLWANFDEYNAVDNPVAAKAVPAGEKQYTFKGSQSVISDLGNYLLVEAENRSDTDTSTNVIFYDSSTEGARGQYYFTLKPGKNSYLFRISQDYFWDVFNIDTIEFGWNDAVDIEQVRILEGD